jgi:hypothetical protein
VDLKTPKASVESIPPITAKPATTEADSDDGYSGWMDDGTGFEEELPDGHSEPDTTSGAIDSRAEESIAHEAQ